MGVSLTISVLRTTLLPNKKMKYILYYAVKPTCTL